MQINGKTQWIGIIADPVAHVKTPQLFNASFAKQGINVVCLPLHVASKNIAPLLAGLSGLKNCLGLVVTIPHKESVIGLCGKVTPTAQLVGAVNTLRWDQECGHWQGANFDGDGFVSGIKQNGHVLTRKRVLIIGAGGAAKAIAYAVAHEFPAEIAIHNRTQARAEEVVARISPLFPQIPFRTGAANAIGFDVVINATSLGLQENDPAPIPVETLAKGALVCEAVMRDTNTTLLAAARQQGCLIHQGRHMLYGQVVEMAHFFGIALEAPSMVRILEPS